MFKVIQCYPEVVNSDGTPSDHITVRRDTLDPEYVSFRKNDSEESEFLVMSLKTLKDLVKSLDVDF